MLTGDSCVFFIKRSGDKLRIVVVVVVVVSFTHLHCATF